MGFGTQSRSNLQNVNFKQTSEKENFIGSDDIGGSGFGRGRIVRV
ncbi:MAG: hypothetical protein UY53_C0003G0079 [Parcubacteria group bacterium GW2011_GWA2_50_10]|nr:MAG: hypothetical protein UY53_C0003G0079 [Parcubacteria group bacterium GW2011_GWA2_50_10]